MAELERRLMRLAGELDWPDTPDLAGAVSARLAAPAPGAPDRRRRARRGLGRSLAIAFAVLLLLAAGAVAAVPSVRDAVLEFFGLQGATVERRSTLPAPPPQRPLELGRRTTLADARPLLAFEPLVPAALDRPGGIYLRRATPGGELSLTYRPRPGLPRARTTGLGLVVSEFRGDLDPGYMGKIADPSLTVERLRLDGERAIWLEGAPHFFFYRGPDGRVLESELRLAQNVLLLERGRLLVRLEGAFGRERALAIARSLR